MSYVNKGYCLDRLRKVRSLKGFSQQFLLGTMAGQKIFLYNERIPRIMNISFNEKTCMFTCKMCPFAEAEVRDHYRSGSFMNFDTLKHLAAGVPNDSYYSFDISAIGETLAFEALPEFIAYMKKEKPLVNTIISTNGILLSEDLFLRLAHSGLDNIQVSLFAENQADHQKITGTRSFEKVKTNLENIGRMKRERGLKKPFIQTFMIECQENRQTSGHFVSYWSQFLDKAFIRPLYNVGREIEGMTPTFQKTPSPMRYPCIMPWYSTAVRSTGEVLPCYVYHWHAQTWDQSIGNINAHTMEEIWQSDAFRKFRAAHLNVQLEDYPVCQKCDVWDAYTNVWEKKGSRFAYSSVGVRDLFLKAPAYRGG